MGAIRFDFRKAVHAIRNDKWKLGAAAIGLAVASPTLLLGVGASVAIAFAYGLMKGLDFDSSEAPSLTTQLTVPA